MKGRYGIAEKKWSTNYIEIKTKFCLRLHYSGHNSYLHVNKMHDEILWYELCSGIVWKDFTKNQQSKISLNRTVYDFSVYPSSVKKGDLGNIHEYLMFKNNTK